MNFKKLLTEERAKHRKKEENEQQSHLSLSSNGVSRLECPHSPEVIIRTFQLSSHRVGAVKDIFYVPDAISSETSDWILRCIDCYNDMWTVLRTRRLQCWGDDRHLAAWLADISSCLMTTGVFDDSRAPNHVLINRYEPSEGIMHHVDGPLYFNRVAILSLESSCVMTFRKKLKPTEIGEEYDGDLFSVILLPSSLLIFSDDAYEHYTHGIENEAEEIEVGRVDCINLELASAVVGDKVGRTHI